jgi:hypothetical protein
MRVKVHQGDWSMDLLHCAKQWKGDRVIPAQGHETLALTHKRQRSRFDLVDRLKYVKWIARNVASVNHLLETKRLDAERRIVGPQ